MIANKQPDDGGWGDWMRTFLDHNLDKLILLAVFMIMIGMDYRILYMKQVDPQMASWTREQTSMVLGGLIGLLTGVAISRIKKTPNESNVSDISDTESTSPKEHSEK